MHTFPAKAFELGPAVFASQSFLARSRGWQRFPTGFGFMGSLLQERIETIQSILAILLLGPVSFGFNYQSAILGQSSSRKMDQSAANILC